MWTSLYKAFGYAFAGVLYALRVERNMRIHWALIMGTLFVELIVRPCLTMALSVILVAATVIALELVNTAIERTVDLIAGKVQSSLARIAKDTAAGAVLVAACAAVAVGIGMLISTYPWHWQLLSARHEGAAWLNFVVFIACGCIAAVATFSQKRVAQEDLHI